MKKWKVAVAAALVLLAAWMLYPRNLGAAFDAEQSTAVSVTVFGITDGQIDNKTEEYRLPAGSEKGARINELLSQHSYHLTVGTLMGQNVIEDHTMILHFNNREPAYLSLTGGTTKLFLNHRVCRLDYFGQERGTELCEEILNILREE